MAEDWWKEVEGHQCSDDVVEQRSPYKVGVTNVATCETKGGGKVRFISREE